MRSYRLEEILSLDFGFAFDSKKFNETGSGLPLARIRDVVRGKTLTYYDGPYDEKHLISNGDYLIGMDGEFNIAKWNGGKALLNQRVCRLGEASSQAHLPYVARYLESALKEVEARTPFVTVKHLSARALRDMRVPLPPLSEQRRIASILDKVDAIRIKRRKAIMHLDAISQSLYAEIVGAREWPSVQLGKIASKIGSGATPRGGAKVYEKSGVPLIRSLNVRHGKFTFKDLVYINDEHAHALKNVIVEAGDVLLNITGASVARVCRAPNEVLPARVNQHVAIIRVPAEIIHPTVLEHYLLSEPTQRRLLRLAEIGATRQAITKREISDFVIPIPDNDAQKKFVAASSVIDSIRDNLLAATTMSDKFTASLQARAFSGKL